jgi:hypothetical protein
MRRIVFLLAGAVFLAGCAKSAEVAMSDVDALRTAEQVLLRDCMKRAGFEYQITTEATVQGECEFPYVIDDIAWAQRHGYGTDIQRGLEKLRADDPNQRYFHSLPAARRPAAIAAANGSEPTGLTAKDPEGMVMTRSDQGCQTAADRELYGDAQAWFQAKVTAQALKAMRIERATADPRFAAATAPWAACMHAAGYDYASPAKLRETLPPPERPLPFPDEQRMAVTEATCALSSGLASTVKALDAHYDAQLRQQYKHDVENERRLKRAALPRARDIVRDAGLGS